MTEPVLPDQTRGGDPQRMNVRALRLPAGVQPTPDPIPTGMTLEDLTLMRQQQARHIAGWYFNHRPSLYATATLDELDDTQDPLGQIRSWLAGTTRTLLLVGPVGVGKTHAAYAIANTAADKGLLTVAVSVPDLLSDLRPGGDSTLAARARTADLLLLDDLGAEKPSEWTGEQLSALIDARIRDERRQVITTNATYNELVPRLGQRTMSRLTGGATVVQMTGDDRRARTW